MAPNGDRAKPAPADTPRPRRAPNLPPWLDARFAADASRTALLLILLVVAATVAAPVVAEELPATREALRRASITWTGISVAVSIMARLGATARRCAERVAGTLVGGAVGLAAASAESSAVTCAGAALAAVVSEVFARGYGLEYGSKLTLVSFCIVAYPALLDTPAQSTRDTRRDAAKFAAARVLAVLIGVAGVAIANVVWFPRAASDDALDAAVAAGHALDALAGDAVAPLVARGGDGGDDAAPAAARRDVGDDAAPAAARRDVVNAGVRRVRGHRAAVARALAHARLELVVARLPTLGACVGGCRRRGRDDEESTAVPAPPPPARRFPVYLPASPRLLGCPRAGLPVDRVAAVEAALGRVAAALRAVGTAVAAGFDETLTSTVATRYGGRDPVASADPLAALAGGVTAAVAEATAGLATVRAAWRDGGSGARRRAPPPSFAALAALSAEVAWVEAERARLDAGHRATWRAAVAGLRRPAAHEPAVGLARLPPTETAAREHARWIALLFQIDETVAAVRVLDGAVGALGVAVGAWGEGEQGGVAGEEPKPVGG